MSCNVQACIRSYAYYTSDVPWVHKLWQPHRIILSISPIIIMLAPRKKLWSTPIEVIEEAIELLKQDGLTSDDVVYDIGAGITIPLLAA